jgi:quercetin dioxygenase-like cupin family protein
MFRKKDSGGYRTVTEKVDLKTLVHGDRTLMAEFHLSQGAVIPPHSHPHEQTGYLVTGRILFTVDGRKQEVETGDSWCILSEVPHSAEALEDSIIVEVFSPVREDYLP